MKFLGYSESQYACYEKNGKVYSAFQRSEVVGRWEYEDKNGNHIAIMRPIRFWGKKEREDWAEVSRRNKERLKEEYKQGLIGEKFARIHGLK